MRRGSASSRTTTDAECDGVSSLDRGDVLTERAGLPARSVSQLGVRPVQAFHCTRPHPRAPFSVFSSVCYLLCLCNTPPPAYHQSVRPPPTPPAITGRHLWPPPRVRPGPRRQPPHPRPTSR